MSLNLLLIISILLVITLAVIRFVLHNQTTAYVWICYLAISAMTIFSYWCLQHYAHSKNDKYYKNTDSCILEVNGLEFSEGKTLPLCSNTGDNSLWKDKAGDLVLETGNDGCYLEGSNCNQPLFVNDKNNPKLFHAVNIDENLTLHAGDKLVIRDTKHKKDILTLKYDITKKWKKGFKAKLKGKTTYYRFVFETEESKADTVETSQFKRGANLQEFMTDETGSWAFSDVLADCFLLRDHFTIDKAKDPKPDNAIHLFCTRSLRECDTIAFLINDQLVEPETYALRIPVDDRMFFYGLGSNASDICSVVRDSTKVQVLFRNPLRYNFPQDTVSGRCKLFMTTNMQEIVDRHGHYEYFYMLLPNQVDNSPYAASGILTYNYGKANIKLCPRYCDFNKGDLAKEVDTDVNSDGFLLSSSASHQNDTCKTADVSYQLRIHDFRIDNPIYQQSKYYYCILLLMFALIFILVIKKADATRKKELYARKVYIETTVYLVLLAFLTVRLIMLWRLHSFPPIKNVGKYEMSTLRSTSSFFIPWVSIYLLLIIKLIWDTDLVQKIRNTIKKKKPKFVKKAVSKIKKNAKHPIVVKVKKITKKVTTFAKRTTHTIKEPAEEIKKPVLFCVSVFFIYLVAFFLGNKVGSFIKTSITILLFGITSSFVLVKLWKASKRQLRIKYYALLFSNTILFFLSALIFEAGFTLPFLGFISIMLIFMMFYETNKVVKVCLMCGAFLLSFLTFSHLTVAKTISPIIGFFSHRMETRMQAMVYEPTELFSNPNVKYKDKENYMQDILNAASNYWYIGNHINYRQDYLKKEHKFFKPVQEYTQKGVSYVTQTRDLSLLRYLNFEHGRGPVIFLCLLLFLLFIVVSSCSKLNGSENWASWLPALAALFLLAYSIYLTLVNDNAVVFVGLDFPFLTLTSVTAPLSFIFCLFAILWFFNKGGEIDDTISEPWLGGNTGSEALKPLLLPAAITLLLFLSASLPPMIKKSMSKDGKVVKTAPDFYVSMKPLSNFIRYSLNPRLEEYQNKHKKKFMSSDRKVLMTNLKYVVDSLFDKANILADCADTTTYGYSYKDTAFIHSVFNNAPNAYSDPDYLVYARKISGQFNIAGNSKFSYLSPIFTAQKEDNWQGDLLAANTNKMNMPSINGKTVSPTRFDPNRTMQLGTRNLLEHQLYNLPGRYCYDGQNRLVFDPYREHDTISPSYILKIHGDPLLTIKDNQTCQIAPMDIFEIGNNIVQIGTEEQFYLAKRLHYNGHYQVIYPLKGDFIFAANFDNMLTNSYHKYDPENNPNGFSYPQESVHITLDYDLTRTVMQYCRQHIIYGDGITVTAIDGNGCVRLLGDYNPNARYIDPNNKEALDSLHINTLLNGEKKAERDVLANRNISKLSEGPGSTIKPVFYAAIASKANLDWPHFLVYATSKATGDFWTKFGNYDLKNVSESVKKDAGESFSIAMPVNTFIQKSNNYFFGSLLMLGTLSPSALEQPDNSMTHMTGYDDNTFPVFKINNEVCYKFHNNFIQELYNNKDKLKSCCLESGLSDNFQYRVRNWNWDNETFETVQKEKYRWQMVDDLGISRPDEYIFPETPSLVREMLISENWVKIFTDHLNITHGGKPISTSPLMMAESFLRIVKANRAPNLLSYVEREAAIDSSFSCVGYNANSYWEDLRGTLFLGMWNVIHEYGGTLYKNKGTLYQLQNTLKSQNIYLYGKTGTCGGSKNKKDGNHHYAFILTNQPIHETGSVIDRKNLKVYVVYFGFYNTTLYNHRTTQPLTKTILLSIINSETFNNYWNEQ